jgi:hypothetical protein
MSKPTKKQFAITNDLIQRTLHGLDELGVPYALILDTGNRHIFTNENHRVAEDMIQEMSDYLTMRRSKQIEIECENEADRGEWGGDTDTK